MTAAVTADDERIPEHILDAIPEFTAPLWHPEPRQPRSFTAEMERLVHEARRVEGSYNDHVAALERSLAEANAELDDLRARLAQLESIAKALDAL